MARNGNRPGEGAAYSVSIGGNSGGTEPTSHPTPTQALAARPSPLAVFVARTEARALLWQAGEMDLHEAVDGLQAAAVASGLVAELGQDEIQRLMAKAFAAVRDDLVPDPLPEERRVSSPGSLIPISTLWAAEYLARENDPKRFHAWLMRHSARERAAIHKHLGGRR